MPAPDNARTLLELLAEAPESVRREIESDLAHVAKARQAALHLHQLTDPNRTRPGDFARLFRDTQGRQILLTLGRVATMLVTVRPAGELLAPCTRTLTYPSTDARDVRFRTATASNAALAAQPLFDAADALNASDAQRLASETDRTTPTTDDMLRDARTPKAHHPDDDAPTCPEAGT